MSAKLGLFKAIVVMFILSSSVEVKPLDEIAFNKPQLRKIISYEISEVERLKDSIKLYQRSRELYEWTIYMRDQEVAESDQIGTAWLWHIDMDSLPVYSLQGSFDELRYKTLKLSEQREILSELLYAYQVADLLTRQSKTKLKNSLIRRTWQERKIEIPLHLKDHPVVKVASAERRKRD